MKLTAADQLALNRSLRDAQAIARRLSNSVATLKAHRAALHLVQVLRLNGAKDD